MTPLELGTHLSIWILGVGSLVVFAWFAAELVRMARDGRGDADS